MRKMFLGLLFLTAMATASFSQSASLTGTVMDTAENKAMNHAVISLLHKKDSTLAHFTRSNASGQFSFSQVAPGKYVMLVSFPKFADFIDEIDVKEPATDLGSIALTLKSVVLQEVIVRSGAAIRIKGDTTEFTADSFVVREGATVEELLKKMPGFQINAKGEITAQGQRVEKVLVDGEEFFGDDPTMATQNISARAVDKVQVYDTKTEQQQITGITNGGEGKTVNIKLKEDSKKGAFGRIYAGSDFQKYMDAKALYNRFKGKKKISFYGTKSNVSTGSLDWEDRQKLGIEDDFEYDEIGGYYFSFGSGDEFNDWSLRGLPNSYSAGALYSNKWNADKNNLNTSYRYNRLATINQTNRSVQSILPGNVNYRNTIANTEGYTQQHALNGKYEWKIDSLASLKFTAAGIRKNAETYSDTYSEYLNGAREFVNTSDQARTNETFRGQLDNQLQYRQAFNKKNRLLLATLRFGVTEDEQNGKILTRSQFYRSNLLDSVDVIDQMKVFDGASRTLGGKVTFSEPLTDKWNLVLDYSYNQNRSESHRNTFNKDFNGKYEVLDPVFSNNFNLDAASHSATAIMRYISTKTKFSFGSGGSHVKLRLNDLDRKARSNYSFLRFTPQAQLAYTIKPQMNINFNYRGTTRQPTIDQLQPIRDNSDNLNIFVGNPDLKVGFNHSISMFFNQYQVLKGQGIWASASYNKTDNAITNFTTIDTVRGTQVYTPINVDGNYTWRFYGNWHRGSGNKKPRYGAYVSGNGGRNVNFISQKGIALRNETDFTNIQMNISFGYEEENRMSFDVRPQLGYNTSRASLQPEREISYFNYGGNINGFVMLPGKLELRSDANFELRQKLDDFPTNNNFIIWNAWLSKAVFKDKSGKIILQVNDILDQNRGFNRNISSSFISEERFDRISRYFLLKFEYTFNKMPK